MSSSTTFARLKPYRHWAMLPFLVVVLVLAVNMFIRAANGATHSYFTGAFMLACATVPAVIFIRGERTRLATRRRISQPQ